MSTYIPVSLRRRIEQIDRGRCCYCQTQTANSGIPLSFDHIVPLSKGGDSTFGNVCSACRTCNEFKHNTTAFADPMMGTVVPLFNPRLEDWHSHFKWTESGDSIEGLTPVGRATAAALQMNNLVIVLARRRWVLSGWHPPVD